MIVGGILEEQRYRLGASPPACDAAAASASRSLRSSRTTTASAVGLTCVARVCRGARVSSMYTRTAGRTPWSQSRVRTSSAGRPRSASSRSLISCTAAWGMSVERLRAFVRRRRTHHPEWLLAGLRLQRVAWRIDRASSGGTSDELSMRLGRRPPQKLRKNARAAKWELASVRH
jgi:hypothetical protein